VDDASLHKYVRQYQNGLGIDYIKLWQRIETTHAPLGIYSHYYQGLDDVGEVTPRRHRLVVEWVTVFCGRTASLADAWVQGRI